MPLFVVVLLKKKKKKRFITKKQKEKRKTREVKMDIKRRLRLILHQTPILFYSVKATGNHTRNIYYLY